MAIISETLDRYLRGEVDLFFVLETQKENGCPDKYLEDLISNRECDYIAYKVMHIPSPILVNRLEEIKNHYAQLAIGLKLPVSLNTERANICFNKAIEKGFIAIENGQYRWVGMKEHGGKAQLAYFCEQVFCHEGTETLPETALNNLFGVKRLGSAITQLHNAQKTQKWQSKIDELFPK